jgi:hypothetical protein
MFDNDGIVFNPFPDSFGLGLGREVYTIEDKAKQCSDGDIPFHYSSFKTVKLTGIESPHQ